SFSDHHWYTPDELKMLEKLMRESNASAVVTTEKDMVKIAPHDRLNQHLIAVEIGVEWLGPLPSHISDMMRGKLESSLSQNDDLSTFPAGGEGDGVRNEKQSDGRKKKRKSK
ncbi:MAG: tetraacyldisaccharide 4'-kinase, partial [Candidatus Obscuribacterales bacterium]|nr:tetraacyldisaccharide 4'-kinase [Candidatus Obscuribacterales bacterium]